VKQLVGGWWEEKVDLTPCNGATPSESRIREIRTYGSMRAYSAWLGLIYIMVKLYIGKLSRNDNDEKKNCGRNHSQKRSPRGMCIQTMFRYKLLYDISDLR
jgi:hypothetical protein